MWGFQFQAQACVRQCSCFWIVVWLCHSSRSGNQRASKPAVSVALSFVGGGDDALHDDEQDGAKGEREDEADDVYKICATLILDHDRQLLHNDDRIEEFRHGFCSASLHH